MNPRFKAGDIVSWIWNIGSYKTTVKILKVDDKIYEYLFLINDNYPDKTGQVGTYYIAVIDEIGTKQAIDAAKIYREVLNEG